MSFINVIGIELQKIKRSKIGLLISLPSLIVVLSGLGSIEKYLTDKASEPWAAMFVQSTLLFAYFMLPFSIIVVCVLIYQIEHENNGIIKMLSLPISTIKLSLAKFCVIIFLIAIEMLLYFIFFTVGGMLASVVAGINISIPMGYLLLWCVKLFLAAVPMAAVLWAISVYFKKMLILLSIGMVSVFASIFVSNTPFWWIYPFDYQGILVSSEMARLSMSGRNSLELIPFIPVAVCICIIALAIFTMRFGKTENKKS